MRSNIQIFNEDCMTAMAKMKDNEFDLAIVDPVYDLDTNYLCPGSNISTTGVKRNHIKSARKLSKQEVVGIDYFSELRRISKDQIIWGINYFEYPVGICGRIIWDKKNDKSTFSNCEIAACSKIKGVRIFRYMWNGMLQENMKDKEIRIHPFQKPVALYKWILEKYTNPSDKILDTHGGSMSLAIACWDMCHDLTAYEIDKDYYNDAIARLERHKAQGQLFT